MKFYQDWLNNDLVFSFIILAVSYAKVNWIRFATLISLKVWTKPKTNTKWIEENLWAFLCLAQLTVLYFLVVSAL